MPPPRISTSRASQACTLCRARKTRCHESFGTSRACLRCSTLRLQCSLASNSGDIDQPGAAPVVTVRHDCKAIEQRLAQVEKTVERLSRFLRSSSSEDELDPPTRIEQAAPLLVIRDAASSPESDGDMQGNSNLVDKGLLTAPQVDALLQSFRRHCGRWIAVDESVDEPLQIQSSLLSCACCLVAARHSTFESSSTVAAALFTETKAMLGETLLSVTDDFEFIQSALILSLWSTTVGQRPLSLDSWLITGMAFQREIAMRASDEHPLANVDGHKHHAWSGRSIVWVHLCLSHLHACISMRRKSMLGKADIERIEHLLSHPQADNFRTRMLAETLLYWTIYQECVASTVVLVRGQEALSKWRSEWSLLFQQPRYHFLQISFWFGQLLMYEQSLHNRSTAVRESLVAQMLELCSEMLRLAMGTSDERSAYLTDHIYHMITFAGVTLVRLLSKYDIQVRTSHDFDELDKLVVQTAHWLKSIGSECHIGKFCGNMIISLHRKARPEKHASSPWTVNDRQVDAHETIFPEFLSMDTFDLDWNEIGQDLDMFKSGHSPLFTNEGS